MAKNKIGKKKKHLIGYLISKGFASAAIDLAENP
jgi:hypothetical protein